MTEKQTRLDKPYMIFIASVILSIAGGLIIAAMNLGKTGNKKTGSALLLIAIAFLALLSIGAWTISIKWYYISLMFLGVNATGGIALMLYYFPAYKQWESGITNEKKGRGAGAVIMGILTGLFLGIPLGAFFSMTFLILIEKLWGVSMPVNASSFDMELDIIYLAFLIQIAACSVGGILASRTLFMNSKDGLKIAFSIVISAALLFIPFNLLFKIPNFQLLGVTLEYVVGENERIILTLLTSVLIVFGAMYFYECDGIRNFTKNIFIVFAAGLLMNVSFSLYLGIMGYEYLLIGRSMEKSLRFDSALRFYEKGLASRSSDKIESYLQHRVGLLYHRTGDDEKALMSFRKVVTKRNANKEFVRDASLYIDRLENSKHNKRKVIPGVESKTEYKSAYCAPNSVSLILNFWNLSKTAREIGREISYLDYGTSAEDIYYFINNQNLNYYFIPFSSVKEIKNFIDMGVPVLAYIPHHVFAIFGYDDSLNTFVTYDVAKWDIWVDYPIEQFEEEWRKSIFLLGVVLPDDKKLSSMPIERSALSEKSNSYFNYALGQNTSLSYLERIRHLNYSKDFNPDFFPAYFDLFDMLHDKERFKSDYDIDFIIKKAFEYISVNENKNPSMVDAFIEFLVSNNRFDEALAIYNKIQYRDMLSEKTFYWIGLIYINAQDYDSAISMLERASSARQTNRRPGDYYYDDDYQNNQISCKYLFYKAMAYENKGSINSAFEQYVDSLESTGCSYKQSRQTIDKILSIGREMGETQKLAQSLKKFLSNYPREAEYQFQYALTLQTLINADSVNRSENQKLMKKALLNVIYGGGNPETVANARNLLEQI